MATLGPTMYQKRSAQRRRTSDITRLLDQYQRNVQASTAEYESAFGQYQKEAAEKMAPFEAEMTRYQTELYPAYEQQAARYRENLASFEQRAQDYRTALQNYMTRGEKFGVEVAIDRSGLVTPRDWKPYTSQSGAINLRNQLTQFGADPASFRTGRAFDYSFYLDKNTILDFEQTGSKGNFSYGYLYKRGGPDPGEFTETFTETLPVMPEAPVAPEVSEFDTAQFEAKRQQLETELTRELGERKSARLSAVSRRSRRPMLQGA